MGERATGLIGTWKSDPDDATGAKGYGRVTLEFGSDGTLLYISHGADKDEIIRLTYLIEPGFIVTNQPSHPKLERTRYSFTSDGRLILAFGGQQSRYVRSI
jgi:hypothetical protein